MQENRTEASIGNIGETAAGSDQPKDPVHASTTQATHPADYPEAVNLLNSIESSGSTSHTSTPVGSQTRWTSDELSRYRLQGDPEVDSLVEKILSGEDGDATGRLGYNNMLMLADQLMKTPELALVKDSKLSKELRAKPAELVEYYDPMLAPDWVDPAKIKLGAEIWQENTLISLGVLYASSLPACYLIKNGIPALYNTNKLRDAKYIYQRIYETGLMLADVMDQGGLSVIEDVEFDEHQLLYQALTNLDRNGQWKREGHHCRRCSDDPMPEIEPQQIHAEIQRLRSKPARYLWGKGYLSAKKVRFLHAAMRFMLNRPERCSPIGNPEKPNSVAEAMSHRQNAWDIDRFGAPVNQEDLAYTLLTFGYSIPKGLEHWGVPLSVEQKEAFLHLWKVVGYIMGIQPELLTDRLDEAEQLFELVQQRQAGASEEGTILTESLMGFFADYLPHLPGFAHRLSTALIINQLGLEHASMIIDAKEIDDTHRWWRRLFYKVGGSVCKAFLTLRGGFYKRSRWLSVITFNTIHETSIHLIESWRGAFIRQPFFIPVDSSTWILKPGVDEAHIERLKNWRRELFAVSGISFLLLMVAVFSLTAAIPLAFLEGSGGLYASLAIGIGSWTSSILLMNFKLPSIFNRRPKPDLLES